YFHRATWVEGFHIPVEDQPGVFRQIERMDGLAALSLVTQQGGNPSREPADPLTDEHLPPLPPPPGGGGGGRGGGEGGNLPGFWGQENGFSYEQRLEGLVSLALGFLTGEVELDQRCSAWLSERMPVWEDRKERRARRISVLLSQQQETQRLLAQAM